MHFYILVRKDLSLPQQMVQAAHAAYESGLSSLCQSDDIVSLVMCQCSNEQELERQAFYLRTLNLPFVEFREPDIDNQLTAIATLPLDQSQRILLRHWKLWREA